MLKPNKSYSELIKLTTFQERFKYLKTDQQIGENSFGSKRWINQQFYQSSQWRSLRQKIIIRDNGCDLGICGLYIPKGQVTIHHIEPITINDLINFSSAAVDPENLITVSTRTHKLLHFGSEDIFDQQLTQRTKNDTRPWRRNDT